MVLARISGTWARHPTRAIFIPQRRAPGRPIHRASQARSPGDRASQFRAVEFQRIVRSGGLHPLMTRGLFLQHWSQEGLAPASVNKLRAMVRTAWNRARRANLLHGENPASDTKPRKVPKRAPAFLEPHEVTKLLAELAP